MIGVYATSDAAYPAADLAAALRAAWPQLEIRAGDGDAPSGLPFLDGAAGPRWDDLLIMAFGEAVLPAALHAPLAQEVAAARVEQRASRVLPVSTLRQRRPPVPLGEVLALHCPGPSGESFDALARRVGALQYLRLRGQGLRVFISHRQTDGQWLAAQIEDHLRANGYDPWRDVNRLDGGDVVQDEIERTIAGTNLLLVLDTPAAAASDWVLREVQTALGRFVPVVSLLLRPGDASGVGPPVYGTAELFSHRIEANLDARAVVQPLGERQLAAMLAAVEDYLSRLLRGQQTLAGKVEAAFRDAGFSWQVLDGRRFLFVGSKRDEDLGLNRLLSHCSALPPTVHWAVKALAGYSAGQGVGAGFTHRLFVYEPALPAPTLRALASDHGFDQDPHLRLLDPSRLDAFLSRYR